MKLHKIFCVVMFCLSSAVWAVDTDGDGVDDSVDAFPFDGCAIADNDGDGMPNDLEPKGNCLIDGFETGNLTGAGNAWVTGSGFAAWQVVSGGRTGAYAARQTVGWYDAYPYLSLSYPVEAPSTLIFYFKNVWTSYGRPDNALPQYFTVDGVNTIKLFYPGPWLKMLVPITTGTHELKWNSRTCGYVLCGAMDIWVDDVGITTLVEDIDDDNDSVMDVADNFRLNAAASSDSDNDGFPGSWNAACDATCQVNSGLTLDNCPTTSNPTQANNDGDAQGDVCDSDDDNDGVPDSSDAFDFDPTESVDTDNDTIGNNADWDDDNDGVPDTVDAAPLNAGNSAEITLSLDGTYKGLRLESGQQRSP